jgi:hypothetical protein
VQIGPTLNNSAKLSIDGEADEVQLSVQGNATQTTSLMVLENSAGTDQLVVTNAGVVTATGAVTAASYDSPANATDGGSVVFKEDSDLAGGHTYTLTLGQSNLSANASCTVDAAGRIPDSCVGDGSDAGGSYTFNADGDNNSPQTIADTNELLIAGGTNGVDTVASATDTITINLDLSEASAGGELGGTLDAPTIDDGISVNFADGSIASADLATVAVIQGGTGAAPGADDQVLVSDSTTAATWRGIPDCDGATTAKLLYDTTTNAITCGTDQNSGSATAWDAIGNPAAGADILMADFAQTMTWDTAATAAAVDDLTIIHDHDAGTDVLPQRVLVITRPDDATGAGTLEALVQLNNNDANGLVTAGIEITSAAGAITTALDASDADIVTALAIGSNTITTTTTTLAATELDVLDNGIAISTEVTGLGTGVATALGIAVGSAGGPVTNGGALGTPSSGTLTNATDLPFSGLASATNTSAAMTISTGASIVFNTTTSGTGAMTGTDTLAGDAQLAANAITVGTTGLLFEGATGGAGNALEGLLTLTDPTADRTWTMPDATGTVALTAAATGVPDALACTTCVSLTAEVSGILPGANGGTGNGFMVFTGPTTAEKTFTLPDQSVAILTEATAVTVPQGGTGLSAGTSGGILGYTASNALASSPALGAGAIVVGRGAGQTPTSVTAGAATDILVGGGASTAPVWTVASGTGTPLRQGSPSITSPTITGTAAGANTIPTSMLTTEVRSMTWGAGSWSPDGAGCVTPTELAMPTGGPKSYIMACADSDTARAFGNTRMPSGWDAGAVQFSVGAYNATSETLTCLVDVTCQCIGDGEAANNTLTTEAAATEVSLVFTTLADQTQWAEQSGTNVCTGTCAANDILKWELEVDLTGSGATCATNVKFVELRMEYTSNVGD